MLFMYSVLHIEVVVNFISNILYYHYSLDANNKRAKEGMERAEKKSELNSMDSSYVGDSLEHSSEVWGCMTERRSLMLPYYCCTINPNHLTKSLETMYR